MKVQSGPAARGEALRERILWAAREVFLASGFERASMDVVAQTAGTTKRTVYAHFESKEKLFVAMFELVRGYFLGRLKTPDSYGDTAEEALVHYCGRFLETLLWEGAIRVCRLCAAEAARFPDEAAQYCYVVFTEVEDRLAAYLGMQPGATAESATLAAKQLLGQLLYPQFIRTLYGVDAPIPSFDEAGLSPDFDLTEVRRAVAGVLATLG